MFPSVAPSQRGQMEIFVVDDNDDDDEDAC